MPSFYIIAVIYNQFVKNCCFIKNISQNSQLKIIVVDNSVKKEFIEENSYFCMNNNITYICMHDNAGLSKAYNKAIESIPKNDKTYIILLDQDTEIPTNFIDLYVKAIIENPEKKIFCPIITDSKGIMSPSKICGYRYKHSIQTDYNNKIDDYSFINSCMCINSKIFDNIKYDEGLFLDCIDHDFIKTIRTFISKDIFFIIDDLIIFQNFSGVTNNPINNDLIRFRIYLKDMEVFFSKWYRNKGYAKSSLFLRALKLSLIHKNIIFLKELLK